MYLHDRCNNCIEFNVVPGYKNGKGNQNNISLTKKNGIEKLSVGKSLILLINKEKQ